MIILSIEPQPSPEEAAAIELAVKHLAHSMKAPSGVASRWARANEFARRQQSPTANDVHREIFQPPAPDTKKPTAWTRTARSEAIAHGV